MHMIRRWSFAPVALGGMLAIAAGCADTPDEAVDAQGQAFSDESAETKAIKEGKRLFDHETFGGNGRACRTCHTDKANTLSPAEVEKAFQKDPNDPLFRSIDSDDGVGNSYTRLRQHATVRVRIPLPPRVRLADDPTATHVILNRGVPTINNTPALDPILMSDGRAPNLSAQAFDAVFAHFEPTVTPTTQQVDLIALFEKTQFSHRHLEKVAEGKETLTLPEGITESEKRGREFFAAPAPKGLCGSCHGQTVKHLLNEQPNPPPILNGTGLGGHFHFALAGELEGDQHVNELRTYIAMDGGPAGPCNPQRCVLFGGPTARCVTAPVAGCAAPFRDPGRLLVTGNLFQFANFKIPILRDLERTAPYFHDNSADTLEEVVDHYERFFNNPFIRSIMPFVIGPQFNNFTLTPQDKADIVAFMKLL